MEILSSIASGMAPNLMEQVGSNPVQLAGRLVGLGEVEQDAGVPKWGWFVVGLVLGGTAMLYWGEPLRKWVRR